MVSALVVSLTVGATASLQFEARCAAGEKTPSSLAVRLALPMDGAPVFRLDDRVFGSDGQTALVSNIVARDDDGPLPLAKNERTDALELKATRAARGVVTLEYLANSVPTKSRGARHGLRHDATGIGGLGAFFLLLPESSKTWSFVVDWSSTACGREVETFHIAPESGTLEALRLATYFAGQPRVFVFGFFKVVWFGQPSFDLKEPSAHASDMAASIRVLFHDMSMEPYTLIYRVLPEMGDRSQGMGQSLGALIAIGPETKWNAKLRLNTMHEMLHRWLGLRLRIEGEEGANYWFTEGFTVHFAATRSYFDARLPAEDFLAEVNAIATKHFANPRRNATNAEIARGFFDDDLLSVVPYTRGALIAAALDARLKSKGRSLDDAISKLPPKTMTLATLRAALGSDIDGQTIPAIPKFAYGECFERVDKDIPEFELGFDERRSRDDGAIHGLVKGSAAARAGLREGETFSALNFATLRPDEEVVVKLGARTVRYFPASATKVKGFGWKLAPCDDR